MRVENHRAAGGAIVAAPFDSLHVRLVELLASEGGFEAHGGGAAAGAGEMEVAAGAEGVGLGDEVEAGEVDGGDGGSSEEKEEEEEVEEEGGVVHFFSFLVEVVRMRLLDRWMDGPDGSLFL